MSLGIRVCAVVLLLLSCWVAVSTFPETECIDDIEANVSLASHSFVVRNADNDTVLAEIDKTLTRFMVAEGLRGGASIAISKDGKLVYAKGIGFSNVDDSIPMEPYHVMRIASVSKLVTAIAVMKLVEDGRLSLSRRVFGPLGVLNNDEYLTYKDKRMANITVHNLLNHSGGWTQRWGDPMFMPHTISQLTGKPLPISMENIIRFMQDKRMHFTPGTSSVYSNFGYGILGEVVAKASAMPYEEYVESEMLAPLGIYDMHIGHSHRNHRLPNEALYYESDTSYVTRDYKDVDTLVRRAYGGIDIQTLGSAGGWVASATDLLKLVLTIDNYSEVPDILSEASVDSMTRCTSGFDPLGWRNVRGNSWYRSGTLAATSAMVARLDNNICYVVLLNCANHKGPALASILRERVNKAINAVKKWPEADLLADDAQWQMYIKSASDDCE